MTDNEKAIKAYESAKIALVKRVAKSVKEHPEDWSCSGCPVFDGASFRNDKARISLECNTSCRFPSINNEIYFSRDVFDKYLTPAIYGWATRLCKYKIKAINDSEHDSDTNKIVIKVVGGFTK